MMRFAVTGFGGGKIAAEAMEFRKEINGFADRWTRSGLREIIAGDGGFRGGCMPIAVQLEKISAMELAVAAIRDEAGLGGAPIGECDGPFLRASKVEKFAAGSEDTAIDRACNDGRDFSGYDGDHGFIEERNAARNFAGANERATMSLQRECDEVFVAEFVTDFDGAEKNVRGFYGVAFAEGEDGGGQEQVATFDAIGLVFQKASRASEPAI